MHELALAEGLVTLIAESAVREGFARARAVHLDLGALANVMQEALETGFLVASRGTAAEGAELRINKVPASAWCLDCTEQVMVASRLAECPQCGGFRLMITGGDQMRVVELEVE